MEQVRLLGDDPDDLAERHELQPSDVGPVDLDRAGVDVVQARDEVRRRGLAAARRADQRHQLAGLGHEVDVLEVEGRGEADGGDLGHLCVRAGQVIDGRVQGGQVDRRRSLGDLLGDRSAESASARRASWARWAGTASVG